MTALAITAYALVIFAVSGVALAAIIFVFALGCAGLQALTESWRRAREGKR